MKTLAAWMILCGCATAQPIVDFSRIGAANSFDHANAPVTTPFNQYGANYLMPDEAALGIGWTRGDLNWSNWEKSQGVYTEQTWNQGWIDAAYNAGIKVCICFPEVVYSGSSLVSIPSWYQPTQWYTDFGPMTAFIKWFLQHEGPKISAVEVVNEPNNTVAHSFGALDYRQVVFDMSNAIADAVHSVNPNMPVIGLGDQGSNALYMIGLKDAGGKPTHLDGIVSHTYDSNNGIADEVYEPWNGSGNNTYLSWIAKLRATCVAAGLPNNFPIWETECSNDNFGKYLAAEWVSRRLPLWLSNNSPGDHLFYYQLADWSDQAILNGNTSPNPVYYTIAALEHALNGLILNWPNNPNWWANPVSVSSNDTNYNATQVQMYLWQNQGDQSYPNHSALVTWIYNPAGVQQSPLGNVLNQPVNVTFSLRHPSAGTVFLVSPVSGAARKLYNGKDWWQNGVNVSVNVPICGEAEIIQVFNGSVDLP